MPRRVRETSWKRPAATEAGRDDDETVEGVLQPSGQGNGPGQRWRNVEVEGKGAEDPAGAFREDEDERERDEHLVEVSSLVIEPPDHRHLDMIAPAAAAAARLAARPSQNEPVARDHGGAGEGPDHVEGTVGEVDEAP